jgi:hypothetical protein
LVYLFYHTFTNQTSHLKIYYFTLNKLNPSMAFSKDLKSGAVS